MQAEGKTKEEPISELIGLCRRHENDAWDLKIKPEQIQGKTDYEFFLKELAEKYSWKERIKVRSTIKDRYRLGNIVGKSPAMQEVYELILMASACSAAVVIYGETGTGKEIIARAIHEMSDRHDRAFVPVNCGAIPEALFESEFFGHRFYTCNFAFEMHNYKQGGSLWSQRISKDRWRRFSKRPPPSFPPLS